MWSATAELTDMDCHGVWAGPSSAVLAGVSGISGSLNSEPHSKPTVCTAENNTLNHSSRLIIL